MMPLSLIPRSWLIGGALVLALGAGHLYRVSLAYDRGHAAAVSERAGRDQVAVVQRTSDNAALSIKQDAINAVITKADNETLDSLRARLAAAERMRKPAFCGQSTAPAQTEGTASSNPPNPPSGLLPERVEQDIQALILLSEEVAATGRACQAFNHANGFAP